ncbi:PQQ-binding-like beta-propeller repeat protein [Streptomyces sp. AV19]|uniref:PQQ-binding-like beta-propeller repeat protein n=1 Tax=Streptomyces sp. AV19 TaxID=2793068 RepID=UPI0018FE0FD9|nr:PQQ-binding-like beta-propeller repeat protein [Streptomyces sp. AV19]MBH1937990.1 PQQ-binding-like beta-propeller repeat protein [Streptomyces sp. AV19]MDG4536606.1 PQQ-binding-like beta-propeller repeat protein [Streptomyces sp. AV19]
MGSTARTVLVPAATVVTLLAGLTACGSGSGSPDAPSKAKSTASPRTAAFPGKPPAGLAGSPAWTVPAAPGGASVFALGDAFAVVTGGPGAARPAGGPNADATPAEREGAKVVEFRDARDGRVRATVKAGDARVYAATWHGAPALRVDVADKTASDGMTSDKTSTVSDVYDNRGKKLGSVPKDEQHDLSDGWVVTGKGEKVAPAEGGGPKTLEAHDDVRTLQAPRNREKGSELRGPRFAGGYGFSREEARTGPYSHTKRLVVTELATGKKAWTSSEAGRPDGAVPEDKSKATNAVAVTVLGGDRVVLAWQTEGKDGGTEPWVLSVNDLKTGRLLATGPVVKAIASSNMREMSLSDSDPVFYVTHDPSTDVLTVSGDRSPKWLATAWDAKTGKQLWTQADDENLFAPVASGNGVVYGFTDRYVQDFSKPIAVDVKTKKVLAKDFEADRVPVFSADGHGAVALDEGVFVFAKG